MISSNWAPSTTPTDPNTNTTNNYNNNNNNKAIVKHSIKKKKTQYEA